MINNRLNRPWGADAESIGLILKKFVFLEFGRIHIDEKELSKFLTQKFKCVTFLTRFTSKPLLNEDALQKNFLAWRANYGQSFLLSQRTYVPELYVSNFNLYWQFVSKLSPSDLFLRKVYGLQSQVNGRPFNSFVYFVRNKGKKGFSSGRYLVVAFFGQRISGKLKGFLGFVDFDEYLTLQRKTKKDSKKDFKNCYIKECQSKDEAIEILALLHLEIPLQFFESEYSDIQIVETFFASRELTKRREFLDYLGSKRIAINRIRERSSDIHCITCNQPLTDELSVIRGYGPLCWKKVKKLAITREDVTISVDVYERYAALEFEDWMTLIWAVAEEMSERVRA
jgi:hypothetical protein